MPNLQRVEFSQKSQNAIERIAKSLEDLVRLEKKKQPGDYHLTLPQPMQPVKDAEEHQDVPVTHDHDTLTKVHEALKKAGVFKHSDRLDIVNQLQNAGILFRERSS